MIVYGMLGNLCEDSGCSAVDFARLAGLLGIVPEDIGEMIAHYWGKADELAMFPPAQGIAPTEETR